MERETTNIKQDKIDRYALRSFMHDAAHPPNRLHEASHQMKHKLREDGREACIWQNGI